MEGNISLLVDKVLSVVRTGLLTRAGCSDKDAIHPTETRTECFNTSDSI